MRDEAARVITLGTGGGPSWVQGTDRAGIATAVVVGDRTYLIDAGSGVGKQLIDAGLTLPSLRAIFITHLHSDHVVDLASLMIFGMMRIQRRDTPIPIVGPGSRGCLPWRDADGLLPVSPGHPTPGISATVEHLLHAYATDINDRRYDAKRPSPWELFEAQEITLPATLDFHPNLNPCPAMEPIQVFEDDAVRVTSILVKHPPLAPAFAFRLDCDEGSVVVSGDTAPTDNTVRIADGAELLLHEALDMDWAERIYAASPTAEHQAVLEHHRAAHTTPAQAAAIAEKAGVRTLALHHLVPHSTPRPAWEQMAESFSGRVMAPDDLEVCALTRRRTLPVGRHVG
ncbi:MBL fold metallo-hydrolase [Phytoactinopolyspora mesophila]|uniref:MBL fold metallo-hydrolase n=1 Tax=Phytoactinopolyspora mesophila TaxID=2650750 RepID=A0A7K3LZN5_9ACTN|nr:MBL fold metallo-hydrolase [Phytoactinopolyspora mesophila]NDL56501.1 MBL fold metallo-hydrolase [Phytoactinopolyspora mesophila]